MFHIVANHSASLKTPPFTVAQTDTPNTLPCSDKTKVVA